MSLTRGADLPHELLVELALPSIRRLALMGERLSTDPHGDSDENNMAMRVTDEDIAEMFGDASPAAKPEMQEVLRTILDADSPANQYPWIFAERILAGDTIEQAVAKAAEGWP